MNDFESFKVQIKEWIKLDYIIPEDIPSIELYMDQVTTFMDSQLNKNKRRDNDKTLTKTMINNYTKNSLLPPPEKKKYTKNHIYMLIYIYYLKNFLSISDIHQLLTPMLESFYSLPKDDVHSLENIYKDIFGLVKEHNATVISDVEKTYKLAMSKYDLDTDNPNNNFLTDFAYIALLGYEIFIKKQVIEKMIDELYTSQEKDTEPKEKAEKKEKPQKR